jgi:hypothetical protein
LLEPDYSHPAAKRHELDSAEQDFQSADQSLNGQRFHIEMNLHDPQVGDDISPISAKASFQFVHSNLSDDADISIPGSLTSVLHL